jgi:hypothetical protein
MKTFYETYKFLLLELSLEDVVKLLDNEKFKRIFTDTEHLAMKDIMINIIPNDIDEKDKANALNWLRSATINDKKNIQYIMRPGGGITSFGSQYLRKYLELFYQIKQQNLAKRFLKYGAIEKYKTFEEFVENLTQAQGPYREYNDQKEEKYTVEEDKLLVYEDNNWEVYFPQTKSAARALSTGADWCTAARGLNYYEKYAKDGQLIIFISKKNPEEKYQLHYATKQYMDVKNDPIGSRVLVLNRIIIDNIIGSEFEKYLSKDELKQILNLETEYNLDMIDDNYGVAEYTEYLDGGTLFVKQVFNIRSLEIRNPYSPTYKISKYFIDEGGDIVHSRDVDEATGVYYDYLIDIEHPDNPDKISELTAFFERDPESGREKIHNLYGNTGDVPPERVGEFAKFMALGIE